jgi:antitoxin CcdA
MSDPPSGKRPVNLTLDSDIVAAARELGINLSQTCNQALAAAVKAEQQARWRTENADAIDAWGRWYDQSGDPLAHLRQG